MTSNKDNPPAPPKESVNASITTKNTAAKSPVKPQIASEKVSDTKAPTKPVQPISDVVAPVKKPSAAKATAKAKTPVAVTASAKSVNQQPAAAREKAQTAKPLPAAKTGQSPKPQEQVKAVATQTSKPLQNTSKPAAPVQAAAPVRANSPTKTIPQQPADTAINAQPATPSPAPKTEPVKKKQAPAATNAIQPEKNLPKPAGQTKIPTPDAPTNAAKSVNSSSNAALTTNSVAAKAITKPRKRNPKPIPGALQQLANQFPHYVRLMRLDKPIGILLLLWPTLWSLWLAAKGLPRWDLLVIFTLGVIVMRSAGCVINDFADREIDGKVHRTQNRPLATGAINPRSALILFTALCLIAFGLVMLTDPLTIKLSVGGLVLAASYPFMKRYTHLPQVVLGAAFAWGIPMAYAAQAGALKQDMWLIYLAVVLWTVVYDTFYAMVDRADDLKIGVKSTAILFGDQDRFITGALQLMTLYSLVLIGQRFGLGFYYNLSLVVVIALFGYQQWLIRFREPGACFKAFLNNNWVGMAVFIGIAVDLVMK